MAAKLEPGPGGRDVVSGALAFDLDENPHVVEVLAGPLVKWGEQLEPVRLGAHVNLDGGSVLGRGLDRMHYSTICQTECCHK